MKKLVNIVVGILLLFGLFVGSTFAEESYIYYYGNGCSHCATLDRYLEKNNAYEKLGIEKREVWGDQANNTEMLDMCKRLGITESSVGIPLFVVTTGTGEFALMGETEIVNHLKPLLGETEGDSDGGKKTIVLVVLLLLAIAIPVTIISLSNKK